jgi:DsbC/DsbD-like thiol-disulfide interchange protein
MKQLTAGLLSACTLLVTLSACGGNSSQINAPVNSPGALANANVNANAGNAASPAPKSPLEGIVSASAERVELRAGETAETSVRLSIKSGYHVNANPATEKFLIPTALDVKPEAGITVEKIAYPKPLRKKFPFAEVPLDVYEGDAVIRLTLGAARDARPGRHTLRADIRVQPCDDEKCYPPATLASGIEVVIR